MVKNDIKEELFTYLNKYYFVENKFFITKDGIHEWGEDISSSLSYIFDYDIELCVKILKDWGISKGLSSDSYEYKVNNCWEGYSLKAVVNLEMINDLRSLGVMDVEAQLINLLSAELKKEIDIEPITYLVETNKVKTSDELIGFLKCLGFEASKVTYNMYTFKPSKTFTSIKYNQMLNERKNNTLWEDWIRTRE